MMIRLLLCVCCIIAFHTVNAQTNITISNPEAEAVIHGNYDPGDYMPSAIINHPDSILHGIVNEVNTDSLFSWMMKIDSFYNRNSGSDTVSDERGIGAVRRWIHNKLEEFSNTNENRLLVSYLDFDRNICDMGHHKNVFGVLPGLDTTKG